MHSLAPSSSHQQAQNQAAKCLSTCTPIAHAQPWKNFSRCILVDTETLTLSSTSAGRRPLAWASRSWCASLVTLWPCATTTTRAASLRVIRLSAASRKTTASTSTRPLTSKFLIWNWQATGTVWAGPRAGVSSCARQSSLASAKATETRLVARSSGIKMKKKYQNFFLFEI